MNRQIQVLVAREAEQFRLPTYQEIPNVGLYLEQTVKYLNEFLVPLLGAEITSSMVSNYVKKGLVSNQVRKQYDREQIASLLFIAVAKSVMSMENIKLLFTMQRQSYPSEIAYGYFRTELREAIDVVFGLKKSMSSIEEDATGEKIMLRTTTIAVAHKIYLEQCFAAIRREESGAAAENS